MKGTFPGMPIDISSYVYKLETVPLKNTSHVMYNNDKHFRGA